MHPVEDTIWNYKVGMIDVAILEPLLISKNKSKKEKSITTCITTRDLFTKMQ